jgi:hypothetical protein
MSIPCKFERSLLSHEEYETIRLTHHPAIYDIEAAELEAMRPRLRGAYPEQHKITTRRTGGRAIACCEPSSRSRRHAARKPSGWSRAPLFKFQHTEGVPLACSKGWLKTLKNCAIMQVLAEEFRLMRASPSIAPDGPDQDIYLVLDDFGTLGRAWRETDERGANRVTLVRNLLDGQYENPVRIIAFNTAEGWSRDATVDIADEVRRRYVEFDDVPESILAFLEASNRH